MEFGEFLPPLSFYPPLVRNISRTRGVKTGSVQENFGRRPKFFEILAPKCLKNTVLQVKNAFLEGISRKNFRLRRADLGNQSEL